MSYKTIAYKIHNTNSEYYIYKKYNVRYKIKLQKNIIF